VYWKQPLRLKIWYRSQRRPQRACPSIESPLQESTMTNYRASIPLAVQCKPDLTKLQKTPCPKDAEPWPNKTHATITALSSNHREACSETLTRENPIKLIKLAPLEELAWLAVPEPAPGGVGAGAGTAGTAGPGDGPGVCALVTKRSGRMT